MRIALLADIHGNLPAFEAALAHARRQGYDQLLILGDVVNGPDSAACWRLAVSLGVPMLRGNHERYLYDLGRPAGDPRWLTPQFAPVQWCAAQHSPAELAAMAALPAALRPEGAPELLCVHASLRSDADSLLAHTPKADLAAMFPDPDAALIVRAHNHRAAARLWDGPPIITVGSVGLPLDGVPMAQYGIAERRRSGWHIEHHTAPFDVDDALERFETSGYLAATGPIGALIRRELATGSQQVVPFLRAYARWSAAAPLSLDEALARFMRV